MSEEQEDDHTKKSMLVPLTYAEVDAILDKIVVTPPDLVKELTEPNSAKVKMHHSLFEKFMGIRKQLESKESKGL